MPRALDACVIEPLREQVPGIDRPDVRPIVQALVYLDLLTPPRPFVVRQRAELWQADKLLGPDFANDDVEVDSAWDYWPDAKKRQGEVNRAIRQVERDKARHEREINLAEQQAHFEKLGIEQEMAKRKESPCSSANATAS